MLINEYARAGDVEGLKAEIQKNVDLNALDERGYPPLGSAIRNGSLACIKLLIEAGANTKYLRDSGYDALIDAIFSDALTVQLVELLIDSGAPLNGKSSYGESAMRVASNIGRFDVIKLLLERGADGSDLEWTELMHALVFQDLNACQALVKKGADLNSRDSWERTPWLLSIIVGDIEKAKMLMESGSDLDDRGRCGKTPFAYAIENNNLAMLDWLLSIGLDPNMHDDFQNTGLIIAAESGKARCMSLLLNAGADVHARNQIGETAIRRAASLNVAKLLLNAGCELNDINDEVRAELTKLPHHQKLSVTETEFLQNRARAFGVSNPHKMNNPFWCDMVRSGLNAYQAAAVFQLPEFIGDEPTWCFERFGKSINELPDGRIIEIGGEHEDWYDKDFCIYNDVVVHYGDGSFDIYGYPESIFPPTDFHTATLVGNHIYIIGNLGYSASIGVTPIYRLDCKTYEIEQVRASGTAPGWICKHNAKYLAEGQIRISGGEVYVRQGEMELLVPNEKNYILCTESLIWSVATDKSLI